jgi:hypothetical protein
MYPFREFDSLFRSQGTASDISVTRRQGSAPFFDRLASKRIDTGCIAT